MKRALATLLASAALVTSAAIAAPTAHAAAKVNYLALGDSYPYGQGLSPAQAYPAVLQSRYSSSVSLTNNAASGATTTAVLGQIIPDKATVITLTAGADDLNWTGVLQSCLGSATCTPPSGTALSTMSVNLAKDITVAQQKNPRAKILVTGYPELFDASAAAYDEFVLRRPCTIGTYSGQAVTVSGSQATQVNAMVDAVDLAIASGVALARYNGATASYVNVSPAFTNHRLCDTYPWVFDLDTPAAAFHPNAAGQMAYATTLNNAGFGTAVTSR
ncbi:SGNH/GDSL hydrolase family protein [Raineyella fluvialis]|uniref:SGNH hydrolase-type esterase domain-containing protein n=1 Tax=Raineyella fluvialis TaxID=2662261 RepID=A0A5Q2FCY1_9ACTN|nr:SGNH/GDSL hydrolase family protein [Raineyella fluvialis]QGF23284.1 hypothetical protein Rai3103_05965 [Raineyella fluvialis]